MSKHVMQFNDGGADWCIHCGTFDIYCEPDDCEAEPAAQFDFNKPGNGERILRGMFGEEVANAISG